MIAFKLALRNLIGAGLRTWLTVTVLSLCYVVIIWYQGVIQGWNEQASRDSVEWEIGGGQYWQAQYDPYDPLTLDGAHTVLPDAWSGAVRTGALTPVLIASGSMYPQGRVQSVLLKGIDPGQKILAIPSSVLAQRGEEIPALIGGRMAKANGLKVGDLLTIRWRDRNGTFDARDAQVVHIMRTDDGAIDRGQIWLPLNALQEMLQMPGEATMLISRPGAPVLSGIDGWRFKSQSELLQPIKEIIKTKSIGSMVISLLLLSIALLAIFDTQVLSIFRRRREIGTFIALGMTRGRVIRIFTIEGAMNAVLAAAVAAIYGIPFLTWFARTGMKMPEMVDDMGLPIAETIFPYYSIRLIVATILIVLISVTVVSFLPTRKISKWNPTDALRGKLT